MDPRGRARVAARLFQPAAERFGYVLISSYNSASDVPPEVNVRAIQSMWEDAYDWFSIDPRRVYLAGFSGTARMATLLAQNKPDVIAGVIGAAAGYHPSFQPSKQGAFLYFATVGDVDYNFHEIETLEQALVSFGRSHRIERFPGPHSWMPPALAIRAVEWLELRAMQAGTRPVDSALIEEWWQREAEAARASADAGRRLDAARRYAAMARDFRGLRDVAEVADLAEQGFASDRARNELRRRQAEARAHREWISHSMQLISNAFPEGSTAALRTASDLGQALEVGRLKKVADSGGDAGLEAQRRLNELEVQLGFYLPHEAFSGTDASRAGYYLSVALQINDRSPVTWYLRARAHAVLNGRREALESLKRAVDAGFRDVSLLERETAFRRLESDPAFQALLAQVKAAGDPADVLTVDRPPQLPLR